MAIDLSSLFQEKVSAKCMFCVCSTDNVFSSRPVCDNCVDKMIDEKLKMISYTCVRCGRIASIQYFPYDDKVCGKCTEELEKVKNKKKTCKQCDGTGKETYTSAKSGKEHITICSACQGRGVTKINDE